MNLEMKAEDRYQLGWDWCIYQICSNFMSLIVKKAY